MPSFDEVLKEAGEFGRFQKRVFFLLCQTGITFSSLFASVVFLGRAPGSYWCRIPGAAELSERCGWTIEEERNFTVLPLPLGNGSSSGQCERLDVVWDTSISCTSPLASYRNSSTSNLPLITCHNNWVYEQPHSSIISEYNLVCGNAWMLDLSQAILNLGFLAGAFILGYAADRYGRILIYLLSCLGVGICGIIVAFAPNFTVFLIFRFLQGMFGKGTWLTCYVIVTEIVGSDQRIVGIVIQIFFTLGIMILPGIAYLAPTWQGIQLAISLPNFLFLLYYW
ncbi:PREDICTED: solute carrier family 22 member 3-like [Apaloderma vittatum]|uniref:Solute carrier family 22 member 3 n=1 Tax=Apaloderma vittatum TaxID=57397 RepID=A0A091NLD0_APAVI|nr:PREDICTED: solute carrier family 22 member 3-like [Apaloderma vittatum]KFP90593.1 Solute carrier family 22 member 3 [Apaloderma vittatum]